MAKSNAAMGVIVCGMMMMVMIMGAAAQAPAPSVDCTTVVLTLSDCLDFVTGTNNTPSTACCNELSSVVKSSPQCLCLLFNTSFVEPLGINITQAQQLPSKCKVQTPPTSLCAAVGIPVPGPVSSVSPVMAPPPSTKSPVMAPSPSTKSPALSPTAPSSSPTPAMASSPSPATSAPTGSNSPAGSPSNVPSSPAPSPPSPPNSAHSITSRNAGIAASLLLLASFFLS